MKLRGLTLVILSWVIPSILVAEVTYTQIADTAGGFSVGLFPSINATGTVAFNGSTALGAGGIYVGNGGPLSSITEFHGQNFGSGASPPTINDSGVVTFYVARGSVSTLYAGTAGTLTALATSDASLHYFFGIPAINSSGTVAFGAVYRNNSEAVLTATGTMLTTIAQTGSMFGSFQNNGGPSINNSGTVAFIADRGQGRGTGVFVNEQGNIRPIALDGPNLTINGGRPALNSNGTTAFVGTQVGGNFTQGIYTSNGGELTLVTTGGLSGMPALNDLGAVAYNATLSNSGEAIFIISGPNLPAIQVIAKGDSLFGSTVASLTLSTFGLNNAGQIAFGAQLADGRDVIVRADVITVPEPATITLLVIGLVVLTRVSVLRSATPKVAMHG